MKMSDDEIQEYLNGVANYWRKSDQDYAKYYVDAFLSVHMSLFGYWIDDHGNRIEVNDEK